MPAPQWHHRLAERLAEQTDRITSGRVIARALIEGEQAKKALRMGKLQEVARRIADTKRSLEADADKLAGRLDELAQKAPIAFSHAESIVEQHHADLDAMESELRQFSNLGTTGNA